MTAHQGQPDTRAKPLAPDAPLRVILVGRTGLDAALRLDSAIELIRARTPLEALGELSDPIDESSPAEVTVVVGADAAVGQYASDFVDGLRLVEPHVRIYIARADGEAASHEARMDGVIDPRKPADVIRRAVRGLGAAAAGQQPESRIGARPAVQTRQAVGGAAAPSAAHSPTAPHGAPAASPMRIFEPTLNGGGNGHVDAAAPTPSRTDSRAPSRPLAGSPSSSDDAPGPSPGDSPQSEPAPVTTRSLDPGTLKLPAAEKDGQAAPRPSGGAAAKPEPGERDSNPREHDAVTDTETGDRSAPPDERSVLDAMLTGGDVLEAVLDVVRNKTGAHDIVFIPGDGDALVGAEVAYRHRPLGVLRSVHASRAELAHYADRVARWIVLRDQQSQLRTAAMTDELTGAYNRRYFTRFLAAAMDQARRNRTGVTLMAFDIDDFKVYNDRYGHAAGDDILTEVVRLLKSVIRPTDRVCRTGGDEFVVIFHEPTGPRAPDSKPPTSVFEITKRFQRQICEHHFPKLLEEAPGTLTISGGLATYPWDGRTAEELLERADQLSLESKRQGKNAITLGPGAQRVCGVWD
jgi:diguanylate cyclase (GGDEF)-like protein